MNLSSLNVVVVGGAIAGASAALLLARGGARVTLVEKSASARAVGAAIALAENGLAVLGALGFSDELERRSCAIGGVRLTDSLGKTLFVPRGVAGAPRLLMTKRSDLYGLLARAVEREPRIEALYAAELSELRADGSLIVECVDGARTLRADLVVGADGVHSKVRCGADFGARVERSAISYARALAPEGLAQDVEAWTPAGLFGSFAVPAATYWYASLGTRALRRATAARDLAALRQIWTRAYPPSAPLLASLESFDQLLVNEVVRVRCERFHSGACVLIGDAAHAMAPNLGQGANSALVDAAVLLDELCRHDALDAALSAYDERRRPKVDKVATLAGRLGSMAEYTNPFARRLRDGLLTALSGRGDAARMANLVWQEEPERLATTVRARLDSRSA
jgi:2-polyprenyl-6-methoxyphenol hydroxylase-like FAD-dependent oxidoreductase